MSLISNGLILFCVALLPILLSHVGVVLVRWPNGWAESGGEVVELS